MSGKCSKCLGRFDSSELLETKPDVLFCSPCYKETYFKCGDCHKTKLRGMGVKGDLGGEIDGRELCQWCFFTKYRQCVACKCQSLLADGLEVDSSRFFCKRCSVDRHFECGYCNRKVEIDQLWQTTPDEGKVCHNCRGSYEAENNPPPIASYSFKPRAKFRGTPANKLFFGFELEVHSRNPGLEDHATGIRRTVKDEKGAIVYCKSDSSIGGGFEIVSHPFGWEWFLQNHGCFDPIFALVKKGFTSHDSGTCGMHIHLSKDAFDKLHLYKFLKFVQNEKDFMITVSQRGGESSFARVSYRAGEDIKKIARNKGGHSERYQAVNLSNPKTIEIRIFRGTLKKERFMKNVEFCRALYEYTKQSSLRDCILERFIGFVWKNRSEYPNLYDFLEERYKFTILKKSLKDPSKPGIRYSGPKGKITDSDISDAEWEIALQKIKSRKDADIQKSIHSHQERATAR